MTKPLKQGNQPQRNDIYGLDYKTLKSSKHRQTAKNDTKFKTYESETLNLGKLNPKLSFKNKLPKPFILVRDRNKRF